MPLSIPCCARSSAPALSRAPLGADSLLAHGYLCTPAPFRSSPHKTNQAGRSRRRALSDQRGDTFEDRGLGAAGEEEGEEEEGRAFRPSFAVGFSLNADFLEAAPPSTQDVSANGSRSGWGGADAGGYAYGGGAGGEGFAQAPADQLRAVLDGVAAIYERVSRIEERLGGGGGAGPAAPSPGPATQPPLQQRGSSTTSTSGLHVLEEVDDEMASGDSSPVHDAPLFAARGRVEAAAVAPVGMAPAAGPPSLIELLAHPDAAADQAEGRPQALLQERAGAQLQVL